MNEYEVTAKNEKGVVYADDCAIFPATYGHARMAQFYRNKRICHTTYDVEKVVNVDTGEEVEERAE